MGSDLEIGETKSRRNVHHTKNILFPHGFPERKTKTNCVKLVFFPSVTRLDIHALYRDLLFHWNEKFIETHTEDFRFKNNKYLDLNFPLRLIFAIKLSKSKCVSIR